MEPEYKFSFLYNHSGSNQGLALQYIYHSLTRKIRISYTGTCIKQTQIIINFRCSADCRTGILIRRFLFNRNNRTQSCNLIDIGTLQISQEITGIRRKGFDIPTLSFGKIVSNAKDDLPLPLSPVITVRLLRGISASIFLDCARAHHIH